MFVKYAEEHDILVLTLTTFYFVWHSRGVALHRCLFVCLFILVINNNYNNNNTNNNKSNNNVINRLLCK